MVTKSRITPLMSMTRTLYDLGAGADILFIHNAWAPADIIFRQELDAIAAVTPNIRVEISAAALQILAPDLAERSTFTCGPAPYMASVRQLLAETGYDMGNYHEESFSFETMLAADAAVPNEAATPGDTRPTLSTDESHETTGYSVEFVKSGHTFTCRTDENILDAAWAAMQHSGGIRPKEITQNKILICCSKPVSDLRFEC